MRWSIGFMLSLGGRPRPQSPFAAIDSSDWVVRIRLVYCPIATGRICPSASAPFAPICRALDAVVVFALSGWHQADHDIPPGRHGWTRATLNNPHRLADLKAVGTHDSHVTLHKSVNPDTEDRAA